VQREGIETALPDNVEHDGSVVDDASERRPRSQRSVSWVASLAPSEGSHANLRQISSMIDDKKHARGEVRQR